MSANQINVRLITRHDTKANLEAQDPILKAGEMAIETDTNLIKVGDDIHAWTELSYINDLSASKATHYEGTVNDDETDEAAITRILGEAIPQKDDIIVLKKVISGDKVSLTAYVYNGSAWTALDGNYSSKNVYFADDLTATADIGVIKIDSTGSAIIPAAGKSVDEVIKSILAKEMNPTITQPAVSVSFTSVTNVEAGTEVTPTYSASLSAGSYSYGPATGITASSWSIIDNATPQNSTTTATGSFPVITVGDSTTYKITATVTYEDGAMPKTNLGNDYPDGQIKAGSASKTVSTAISSYRNFFYGALATSTAEAPVTSAIIRSLTKGGAYNAAKTLTVKAADVAGAKRIIVAYPASTTRGGLNSVLLTSSMNADITSAYKAQTNVEVEGANGYTAVPYKVFIYEPAELNSTEVHQIKLA